MTKPENTNPFAAPQSISVPIARLSESLESDRLWHEGNVVALLHGSNLPMRCWKCNARADVQLRRRLAWHHPSWYLALFGGLLPYLIVALIAQKKAQFTLGLCAAHAQRRRRRILTAWLLSGVGVALVILVASNNWSAYAALIGVFMLLAGLICGVTYASICGAKRIDGYAAWITGAGRPFLASLPESLSRSY
jgi:hypothetical protein